MLKGHSGYETICNRLTHTNNIQIQILRRRYRILHVPICLLLVRELNLLFIYLEFSSRQNK